MARDPGSKPGYVWLDGTGAVLAVSHQHQPWVLATHWDIAATEGQWWFQGCDADPNRLFTLAFEAGWSLRGIPAKRYMKLPPRVWRGGGSAPKEQVQRRIAKELTVAERKLFASIPSSRHGDCLDAIGIGRGALRVQATTTEYDWPKVKGVRPLETATPKVPAKRKTPPK